MSEWISVKDKLPKEPGYYLVCWSLPIGPAIDIVYWRGKTWARGNQRITYWMPLPEPPKRSSEDNKHCAIFAATKARAHLIFCNFLAIKLFEGAKKSSSFREEKIRCFFQMARNGVLMYRMKIIVADTGIKQLLIIKFLR